jgi:hypothetical protein
MRLHCLLVAGALASSCALAASIVTSADASPRRERAPLASSTMRPLETPTTATPRVQHFSFPTSGTLRVLLVPISWPGAAQIQTAVRLAAMLSDAAAYYREASQGRLQITGDVAAPVALAGVAYAQRGLADGDVTAALAAAGVDLSAYDRVVYAYPHIPDADWNGQADAALGAPGEWVDLNGDEPSGQLEHELGHTLGLEHAHALACSGGILSGRCLVDEYGDATDLMGSGSNAGSATLNALERYELGWIEQIGEVTRTGAYALAAVGAPDAGPAPRALVVETARGELWIERAPGRGTFFVHLADPSAYDGGSRLLETSRNDGVFSQGSPFHAAGITITPLAAASGILTLAITLD